MDLSAMPTGRGLDAMAAMLPHMEAILHDESFNRVKDRMRNDSSLTLADVMGEAYAVIATKNRGALYGIVAAVTGKTVDEVSEMPLEETLSVFQGAMGSKVLVFFIFCARMVVRL